MSVKPLNTLDDGNWNSPRHDSSLDKSPLSAVSKSAISISASTTNSPRQPVTALVGCSPAIEHLLEVIKRIAPTNSSVLITGETGTGKELVARTIHENSLRHAKPFVDINCSAIPDTLFESELFGHQRGTFTGAHENRRGLFEEASGGTIFLDEVDALSLTAQAKLLRVLQERRLRRVGGRENIHIDIRIIAATNCDLQAAVGDGLFRPDLFFRLRVVPIHVPQLRERSGDIELLVQHFLQRHAARHNTAVQRFSAEAMRALTSSNYPWAGNVRELENAVEYALAISTEHLLGVDDLPPGVVSRDASPDMMKTCLEKNASLAEVERLYILSMYERCNKHQIKTASALGIDRRTLYRKLLQYGIITQMH